MQNLYEIIKNSLFFNKFLIDDLVCVEYTCPLEEKNVGIFAQHDYIIHVLSGVKTWKTIHGEWEIKAGQTLYVKKGAALVTQFFDEDFCMLGFFLPDDLIRQSIDGIEDKLNPFTGSQLHKFTATRLREDTYLESFFQSMLVYFSDKKQPAESIIKLKLKELLLNIVYNCDDKLLISYLKYIHNNASPSLTHIMETNFCFNLKLEEFAKLSHRSLSTFKRDFYNHYNATPGKWLLEKRLDFAANLLINKKLSISQIAFDSGFEHAAHFSRVFKNKFGDSPLNYRERINKNLN